MTEPIDRTGTPDEMPVAISAEIEKQRQSSARLLRDFADTLQRTARTLPSKAGRSAGRAATQLQISARYVQRQYLRGMAGGLSRTASRHPVPALLVAAAAGYVVGRALRSRL
jgi:hypothetical protein